jgi:peptidoglycan/LPS O-acetylase OafA/YrhL
MGHNSLNYRADIDGLRAVAVLQVLLFHAGFGLFKSGFIGVDVFFVISGFLITGILLKMQKDENFKLRYFYERRIRRILPALFAVTLASVPIAYWLMLPDDLENFGQSQIATVFSVNNILLWLTENYFSVRNEFKPLVHTWSLGVEEQFYIFYPIFFYLIYKIRSRIPILYNLSILWIASFLAAIWGSFQISSAPHGLNNFASASFYNLPTRAFELLTGAIAFFVLQKINNKKLSDIKTSSIKFIGISLIVGSGVFLPIENNYPNFFTLIPLFGAFLLLVVEKDNLVTPLLSNHKIVKLGLASYSIYLIHQPLFAFYRLSKFDAPTWFEYVALIIIAVVLGVFSLKYIEAPFRNRTTFSVKKLLSILSIMSILILYSGSQFVLKSGYFRGAKYFPAQSSLHQGMNAEFNMKPFNFRRETFIELDKKHILVVGNSQARDFINALITTQNSSVFEILYRDDFNGCTTEANYGSLVKELIESADYVVFGSAPAEECWSEFRKEWISKIERILVLGEKSFGLNVNAVMVNSASDKTIVNVSKDVLERNQSSMKIFKDNFLDMNMIIGLNESSVPILDKNGYLISQDGTHLTPSGAVFVGNKMRESGRFNFSN